MKIIFCISYLSVPLTISIIEEATDDFLIITDQDSLYQLFSTLYDGCTIIKVKPLSFTLSKTTPLEIIKVVWYKRKYWNLLSKFENADVYFFFEAFGHFESWLIKKLAYKNNIFYKKVVDLSYLEKVKKIKSVLNQQFIRVLYGQITDTLISGKMVYYAISARYLQGINAKDFSLTVNKSLITQKVSKVFDIQGNDILFLMGGVTEEGFVTNREYIAKMTKILDAINADRIMLKYHPRYTIANKIEAGIQRLPDFIPANIILGNFKIIVGYETSTIFVAANEGKIAISLLNYYIPISDVRKNSFKRYLNENTDPGKKIYFPETVEEILLLLG